MFYPGLRPSVPSIISARKALEKEPTVLTACRAAQAREPVLLRPLQTMWCHLCVHDHCQNRCVFVAGQGEPALVLLCWGGCCFSKSYLLCLPTCSSVPLLPPLLLYCSLLSQSRCPSIFGKHICNIRVCFGTGPTFHLMLYV